MNFNAAEEISLTNGSPLKQNSIDELQGNDFSGLSNKFLIGQTNIDQVVDILDRASLERKNNSAVTVKIEEVVRNNDISVETLTANVAEFVRRIKENENFEDTEAFNLHSPSRLYKKDAC